ncbi:Predicted AAA-ATPase, partial [Succinivibrio dextrinosolvens]|uniref:AAA family ATPase n=1 Tax=Succinivibrio dextrinosolvens TaxID=83771 RepID=UPI0008EA6995
MPNPERLSTSNNRFEDLRRSNQIYVDHTDLLYEIVRFKRPSFLSRPRRFGKSLLISTLESLFSNGTEYFKGLKIEKLWNEKEQGRTYKVIHLDFSSMAYTSPKDFDLKIYEILYKLATKLDVDMTDPKADYKADTLLKDIISSDSSNFVLLIDEYDYPLTHSLENKELFESYRQYLQGLFGA